MISVKLTLDKKDDFIKEVVVSGHARSDEHGKDLVCCSVSTLGISLINGFVCGLKLDLDYVIESGYLFLKIDEISSDNIKLQARGMLKMFTLALEGLESEHKSFLRVEIREV